MAAVLFLSSDLMFSSRVGGAAKALNVSLQLVADPAALPDKLTADCRLVLVDLSLDRLNLPAVVVRSGPAAPRPASSLMARTSMRRAWPDATDAGCDLVLTRNQFHQQHADLLRSVANGP